MISNEKGLILHPDGSLEIFDEKHLIRGRMIRSTDLTTQDPGVPLSTPQKPISLRDQMSQGFHEWVTGFRQTSLTDMFRFIAESLRTYQSWHYQDIIDPWMVTFPYARYLAEGDKIINRTTGETYTVERVLDDGDQMKSKKVKLKAMSSNAKVPADNCRLLLDAKNMINFHWSYVSADKVQEFATTPDESANPKPFTDTITFGIIRKQPGGTGKPFEGVKEAKPRFRRNSQDSRDGNYVLEENGQFFDSLVEISCWSTTVSRSQDLLEWLEAFVARNTWVWKFNGIQEILYWERREDTKSQILRADAFARPLVLFVRTEEVWIERQRKIKCLDYIINVQGLSTAETVIDPTGFCDDITFVINDRDTINPSG